MDAVEVKEEAVHHESDIDEDQEFQLTDFEVVSPLIYPLYVEDGDADHEVGPAEMALKFEEVSLDVCDQVEEIEPSVDPLQHTMMAQSTAKMPRRASKRKLPRKKKSPPTVPSSTDVVIEPAVPTSADVVIAPTVEGSVAAPPQRKIKHRKGESQEDAYLTVCSSPRKYVASRKLPSEEPQSSKSEKKIRKCTVSKWLEGVRFPCLHCPETFESPDSLAKHYQQVNYCTLCKLQLFDYESFYLHITEIHTTSNACDICNCLINSEVEDMHEHARTHTIVNDSKFLLTEKDPLFNPRIVPRSVGYVDSNIILCDDKHICIACNSEVDPTYIHFCQANICNVCHIGFNKESLFVKHIKNQHFTQYSCNKCFKYIDKDSKGYEFVTHLKKCIENDEIPQIEAQTISAAEWEANDSNVPLEIPQVEDSKVKEIIEIKPKTKRKRKVVKKKLKKEISNFETVIFDENNKLNDFDDEIHSSDNELNITELNNDCNSNSTNITGKKIKRSYYKQKIKCKFCSLMFENKTKLNLHNAFYHVKCYHCYTKFQNRNELIQHYMKLKGVKCDICKKQFTSKVLRNTHLKSHLRYFKEECKNCLELVSNLPRKRRIHKKMCDKICVRKGLTPSVS